MGRGNGDGWLQQGLQPVGQARAIAIGGGGQQVVAQGGGLAFGGRQGATHRLKALAADEVAQGGGGDRGGVGRALEAAVHLRLATAAGLADASLGMALGVMAPEAGPQGDLRAVGRQHGGQLPCQGTAQGRLHLGDPTGGRILSGGGSRHGLQALRPGHGQGRQPVAAQGRGHGLQPTQGEGRGGRGIERGQEQRSRLPGRGSSDPIAPGLAVVVPEALVECGHLGGRESRGTMLFPGPRHAARAGVGQQRPVALQQQPMLPQQPHQRRVALHPQPGPVAEARQLRPVAVDHLQGEGAVGGSGGPDGRPGERVAPVVENGSGQVDWIKLVAMAEMTHQGEDLLFRGMADATAQAEEQTRLIQVVGLPPSAGLQQLAIYRCAGGYPRQPQPIEHPGCPGAEARADGDRPGQAGRRHHGAHLLVVVGVHLGGGDRRRVGGRPPTCR